MAQVTLRINGYSHTLVCKDGEENHLLAMANEVEQRIEAIKAAAGQSGESRMLVMAALMMADDLFELRRSRTPNSAAASAGPRNARKRLQRTSIVLR